MNVHKKSFQYGPHTVTLETGRMARQADGAVLCSMGDQLGLLKGALVNYMVRNVKKMVPAFSLPQRIISISRPMRSPVRRFISPGTSSS